MDRMQFRDFIFPHNPEIIEVGGSGALRTHLCPGKGEVQQDLGPTARTITCKGCFFGENYAEAAAQLEAFRGAATEAGSLFLPGIAPFSARLRDFSWLAQGDGRILNYTMVFVEVLG